VDRDGRADVVVGAPRADANGADSGIARVFSGRDGSVLFTRVGDGPGDELGNAVAGGFDLDRDGWPDFVIGAHLADSNGADAGLARAFSGRDGAVLLTVRGDVWGDHMGAAVAPAGDVDGDGWTDLVIGAPWADPVASKSGLVRVYSGATGAPLRTFFGEGLGHEFGGAVAHLGDVDGDGFADVLAAAPEDKRFGDDAGSVRVFSGQDGHVIHQLWGSGAYEYFGFSVAGGDVDGDGVPDLIVGAPLDDASRPNAGALHVYSGRSGQRIFSGRGDATGDELGRSVAYLGDVDGDGFGEMIAGIPRRDAGGPDAGAARVYCGAPQAAAEPFGSGCPAGRPLTIGYAGSPRFGQTLHIAVAGGPAFTTFGTLAFGFNAGSPFPLDLGFLGMTGCTAYHSYDFAVDMLIANGAASIPVTIPVVAGICGLVFYNQWYLMDPTANLLGVAASDGGRVAISH
jgi:hypothetical protein